ncbi:O-methyltransferase [Salibacterium lacus]|uniref:tRNA 5-hydroxyuridine methyltransferase n=1 Tax=Salibacterium lacus TaxID=1898109 RepID=A0ABW5SWA7_9BACI
MKDQSAIQTYMECLHGDDHTLFRNMEALAQHENIPIMEKDAMEVVLQLLKLHDSRRILEIGTAIGYSALRMASALPDARIISVEKNETAHARALEFRERSGLADRTSFYACDALDGEAFLDEEDAFDVLFIDAAKGRYRDFFDTYFPYVKKNGLVISDNVFFRGLTAEPEKASGRLRPMVDKIRTFNDYLSAHPDVRTSFLPVGDGVAVSKKT